MAESNNGPYSTVYQDKPGIDKWDGTVQVLGPDGQTFDAYLDIWEARAPANKGKHTRNVRVRATNYQQHTQVPAGGQVERETTAPAGTPGHQPPRIGREQGPPPAYSGPHPGSAKYVPADYDAAMEPHQERYSRPSFNPYDTRDNPQRVGGPDE